MKFIVAETEKKYKVSSPEEMERMIRELYTVEELTFQEMFWVIPLAHGYAFEVVELFKGGAEGCPVFLPVLFRAVLLTAGATSFIVAHNHPSGDLTPSMEDFKITRKIRDAGKMMELQFLDHIILHPEKDFVSLAERGEL